MLCVLIVCVCVCLLIVWMCATHALMYVSGELLYPSWGVLNIAAGYSNTTMTDYQLAMAAGVLEGALTQRSVI